MKITKITDDIENFYLTLKYDCYACSSHYYCLIYSFSCEKKCFEIRKKAALYLKPSAPKGHPHYILIHNVEKELYKTAYFKKWRRDMAGRD